MADQDTTVWDYIVVGAGSAGCVVANRLSANPRNKVLLLEAGGSDRSIFIQMPAATYVKGIGNPKFDWMYPTEPDPTVNGRSTVWPRGKVMGGSSSINGMLYVRGFPQDFDAWKQMGLDGWGWEDVLPMFKRHEDNTRGASEHHGVGGELKVSDIPEPHPIAQAFIETASRSGYRPNADINGPQVDGFGVVQATQYRGWRCSAAKAFVDPVRQRANLSVETHAQVDRLVIENGRAVGVDARVKGQRKSFRVAGEIILCAGAIASPQLLMLSGIGDAAVLSDLGIDVMCDAPEVGKNLQDHPGIGMTYEVSIPTYNSEIALWKQIIHGANWLLRGKGVGTTPDAHVVGFLRSDETQDFPDIQVHVTPAGYLVAGEGELVLKENSFTTVVSVCRPRSRGEIALRSADPTASPAIKHRLFSDHDDLHRLVRGVRRVRQIVQNEPLSGVVRRPIEPSWTDVDDAAMVDYLIETAGTIYHPSGTCRMGADPASVVDAELRVRGVAGLRVADASIMPRLTSGNLNAPCMMIGEKAAAFVLSGQR